MLYLNIILDFEVKLHMVYDNRTKGEERIG